MKRATTTAGAPKAIGPYSQAILSDAKQTLYISGQLPVDPATSAMPDDIAGQTERSLLNMKAILEEAGSSLSDVVKTTVFLKNMADFAAMNEVYARHFPAPHPARVTIQAGALPLGAKVEIEAVAEVAARATGYDFTTVVDRSTCGSAKWEQMKAWNPKVSKGVIPFSVADMEVKNPPEVIEGLKAYLDETILGYSIPTKAYLDAVCGWMERRHGWKIRPEWILGTTGVVPAFFSAIRAFSEPGDGIIVQTPVYYPFYMAIERNARTIVRNPLILSGGTYQIDFEDLERKAADPRNKILLFCSPHNPVGRVWTKEELARVGEICLRHNVLIISDEIHFDLVMPGSEHTVFAALSEELANRMIVCTAPSKTFNLAGMQVSNIVIPNEALRARYQEELAAQGFFSLGALGYKACEIAYTRCEAWLDQLIELVWRNHQVLKAYLAANLPEVKVFGLEGTYLQWMDFRALGMDKDELERFLHMDAELFLDEGYIFGEESAGYERMNLACPTSELVAALERLVAAVRAMKR